MPRGQTARTPERVVEAQRLYAAGLTGVEIAAGMGVSRSTAYEWLNDPHGDRKAARRQRYAGRCVDCGAPTDGSKGRAATPERCQACRSAYQHETAMWTRERLIAEAQRWHALTGAWPTMTHWHSTCGSTPSAAFLDAVLEFRSRTGPWPTHSSHKRVFASWAAFMGAAGGEAVGSGAPDVKNGQRVAEMRAALANLDGTRR